MAALNNNVARNGELDYRKPRVQSYVEAEWHRLNPKAEYDKLTVNDVETGGGWGKEERGPAEKPLWPASLVWLSFLSAFSRGAPSLLPLCFLFASAVLPFCSCSPFRSAPRCLLLFCAPSLLLLSGLPLFAALLLLCSSFPVCPSLLLCFFSAPPFRSALLLLCSWLLALPSFLAPSGSAFPFCPSLLLSLWPCRGSLFFLQLLRWFW